MKKSTSLYGLIWTQCEFWTEWKTNPESEVAQLAVVALSWCWRVQQASLPIQFHGFY